ncbi:hypothetical protein J0S82_020571 [Galemys pyrenaicus]|uniref:Uncharacterized protein n=1 Tax=Galemys pyrenaicus TaxID=202257 RepID=A0A8J6DP42_GALPY|nr:hypothetical protein J0S82_020571 [Galemys pyrenaicus]
MGTRAAAGPARRKVGVWAPSGRRDGRGRLTRRASQPSAREPRTLLLRSLGLLASGSDLRVLIFYKFGRPLTPIHCFLVNIKLSDMQVSVFGVTFTFVFCLSWPGPAWTAG